MHSAVRLGVNVDHVATLRNVRGELDDTRMLVRACETSIQAGADFITLHLREDRRHIQEKDAYTLGGLFPLNLEMAATDEMVDLACRLEPQACCVVPEKRQELTTEGGLQLEGGDTAQLRQCIDRLKQKEIQVALFIEPTLEAVEAAAHLGAHAVELHTGQLASCFVRGSVPSLVRMLGDFVVVSQRAHTLGLQVHAGHGLTFPTAYLMGTVPHLEEVSVGHFVVCQSLWDGWYMVVAELVAALGRGRADIGLSRREVVELALVDAGVTSYEEVTI